MASWYHRGLENQNHLSVASGNCLACNTEIGHMLNCWASRDRVTLNRYFRIPHLSESKCSQRGVRCHTISDHGKTKFEEGLKGRGGGEIKR